MDNIKAGDIYYCDFGQPQGSLQKGVRPCVIVDNYMALTFSNCIHCIPLTTKIAKDFILHYTIKKKKYPFLQSDSLILCEQYQLIDKSQLINKIGNLTKQDLIMTIELCKKNFPFNY